MQPTIPFFREAGSGPGVVCLHSNASSSSQWRALMETLSPWFRVLAADSYGAGKGPAWPADRPVFLRDEVALLEPVFARALALHEPTLFSLVDAESPPPNDADGIRGAVAGAAAALDAGDSARAAGCFIDFWMGDDAWRDTPEPRKGPNAASVANVRGWAGALFGEPTPLHAFARLDVPVLYMTGEDSPASSRGVARILTRTLPQVEVVEFEGLGHMGRITHPGVVNGAISRFLERV